MDSKIVEIFISGPAGRIEAKYYKSKKNTSPIALILHPHPQYGGTMNNKVVVDTFHAFMDNGFSVCRINFRGVGKSDGDFDNGQGELADAAAALDWLERENFDNSQCWITGFSFGSLIAMQLLMRRPEIKISTILLSIYDIDNCSQKKNIFTTCKRHFAIFFILTNLDYFSQVYI